MKYFIQTYGCQMNYSDSERVSGVLERIGYEQAKTINDTDLLIFNTCSVKQKAEDRVLGLRRNLQAMRKKNPKLKIAITGCMARKTSTRNTEEKPDKLLRRMPEVDLVFRIEDVAKLPELLKEIDPTISFKDKIDDGTLENYFKIAPKLSANFSVFVPIMTGCDKFCTYCIVPYTRGREYSRDFDEIIRECTKHVENGALEITLVGQTVNSYGLSANDRKSGKFEKYGKNPFARLLAEVDKLYDKGLRRLRFTSPHPRDFHDELIDTMATLKTLCPYFHMPVQSGDDRTLRRMNRNYTVQEYKNIMRKVQKAIPNCAVSTDIIVGFCGETDEEFETTYKIYEEMQWDMCFLSRYSPRKGTYSERHLTDDISHELKAERWQRLNKLLIAMAKKAHAKFQGKVVKVLVNQQSGQNCSGYTPEMKEVNFKASRSLIGKIVDVKIINTREFLLEGELL